MADRAFESIVRELNAGKENLAIAGVQEFLRKSGDLNRRSDKSGASLLHMASLKNYLDLARVLIEAGIEVEAKDDKGLNAVYHAVCAGHLSMVRFLQRNGADLNARSKKGCTALHVAGRKTGRC